VGAITNFRTYLWIPISQDAEQRISVETFAHVMDLDLTFHLKRKTGTPLSPTCCKVALLDWLSAIMHGALSTVHWTGSERAFSHRRTS
jgi:hypothetical protein